MFLACLLLSGEQLTDPLTPLPNKSVETCKLVNQRLHLNHKSAFLNPKRTIAMDDPF
jgi:hypothetical protein